MKAVGALGAAGIFLALAAPASGAILTVDPAAADGCTAPPRTCRTIGQASAQAVANDTILVRPGTYDEAPDFTVADLTVAGTGTGTATIKGKVTASNTGLTLRRLAVLPTGDSPAVQVDSLGVLSPAKTLTLESSILSGAGTGAALTSTTGTLGGTVTVNAHHVTIADAGSAPALNLVQADPGPAITVSLSDSIVLGAQQLSPESNEPTVNKTNLDEDSGHKAALFVDPAAENFLLRAGAPAIDAGGGQQAGETTEDVEGEMRGATWDRGADEFVNHAPVKPAAFAAPAQATVGQAVNLGAFAGDPDAGRGDTAKTFRWDFGDGSGTQDTGPVATNVGQTTHSYAAPGRYAVTVTTFDQADQPSPASDAAIVVVTAASAGGGGGGGSGGGGGGNAGPDTAAPAVSITSPRAGRRLKRGRRAPVLRGRVSDQTGVRSVELALRRLEGRRCRWYDSRRRAFLRGACARPKFFRAVVNDFAWSFTFPRKVVPAIGRYDLRVRATDLLGRRTTAFSARAKTLTAFRIVR